MRIESGDLMQTNQHTQSRRGYTLLEMLLVLSLLIVIAGFSAPHLMGAFRENQLKEAAEAVRVMAASTRIRALDSDSIWQFRFEPGGRRYVRVPYEELGDAEKIKAEKDSGELPESMVFSGSATASGEQLDETVLEGLPDAGDLSSVTWSSPILFFPDGTAVDAEFHVESEKIGVRRILVREITGAVRVKKIEAEDTSFQRR
jgi:prepilin-type N-terminal cleavage/methylation domain-containing protein